MAKRSKTPSFIRTGRKSVEEAISSGGETFLRLKDGDSIEIAMIGGVDDIISFDQHSFWLDEGDSPIFPCQQDDECPGCMLGDGPQFKAMVTVMVKTEGGMEERLIIFGKSVLRALVDAEDAVGDSLHGKILKYSRKGTGLNTRYSVIPTGREVKVPELNDVSLKPIENLGMIDRDEIVEALRSKGLWKFDRPAKTKRRDMDEIVTPDAEGDDWDDAEFEDFDE